MNHIMTENKENKEESLQAITAFEQILQVMPRDIFALEALHDAYLEKGDTKSAYHYLARLAEIVEQEGDKETMTRISDKLLFLGADYPEANELAAKLQSKSQQDSPDNGNTSSSSENAGSAKKIQSVIAHEISLAWSLFENSQISKEDYTTITNDLAEMSSKNTGIPISVMHVLSDRAVANTEKIVAYIAKESETPLISLENFELQPSAFESVPLEFTTKLGVMPFDYIGKDLMVAMLNPFDKETKKRVAQHTNCNCFFYLVTAPDYDNALAKIRSSDSSEEKTE